MKKLLKSLRAMKVPVVKTTPADDQVDAEITLGGQYDGLSIQVGTGYYMIVRELAGETLEFTDGSGNLEADLRIAAAGGA